MEPTFIKWAVMPPFPTLAKDWNYSLNSPYCLLRMNINFMDLCHAFPMISPFRKLSSHGNCIFMFFFFAKALPISREVCRISQGTTYSSFRGKEGDDLFFVQFSSFSILYLGYFKSLRPWGKSRPLVLVGDAMVFI